MIGRSGFVDGSCSYLFELGNADGRFFEVMPNLTDNWSFEANSSGMPDNWDLHPIPSGTGVDTTVKRTGDNSLKVVSITTDDVEVWSNAYGPAGDEIAIGGVDMFGGSVYRLGGYIKADSTYNGSAYVRLSIYFHGGGDTTIVTPAIPVDTSWAPGGWVWTETIIDPGDMVISKYDTAKLAVVVEESADGGNVWFDEVCFEDVNRIYNGGFEFQKPGSQPDPLMWQALPGGGDDFEMYHAGNKYDDYCCKITPDANDITLVENDEWIYVNPFSEYTMACAVKTDVSGPVETALKPYVRFYDSKDEEMHYSGSSPLYGQSYTGDTGWTTAMIRVTPGQFETVHSNLPADPDRKPVFEYPAYVKVGFEVGTGISGEFYVDGVTFRETNRIKNASFETDRKGDGYMSDGTTAGKKTPDKWVRYGDMIGSPPELVEQGFMDLYKKDNYRSWRVDADNTYHPVLKSDTIPLAPLANFDFAGWQRTHGISGGGNGAEYRVRVYAGDGTPINSYYSGIHADNMNFVERNVSGISAGAAGGFAVVETYATGSGGVVDFDCPWLGISTTP